MYVENRTKIANFHTPVYLTPPLMGFPWNFVSAQGSQKTRMMGLSDGRKSFPIGLAVLIQYRSVTVTQPATQPRCRSYYAQRSGVEPNDLVLLSPSWFCMQQYCWTFLLCTVTLLTCSVMLTRLCVWWLLQNVTRSSADADNRLDRRV